MRIIAGIILTILLSLGGNANASALRLSVPSNVAQSASGGWAASNQSVFSSGKVTANLITAVEGTTVTFPQTFSVAANAASYIAPLLMPGPAGLLTSAVLSWVAQYGLNYAAGQWTASSSSPSDPYAVWTGPYITGSYTGDAITAEHMEVDQVRKNDGCTGTGAGGGSTGSWCPLYTDWTWVSDGAGGFYTNSYPGGQITLRNAGPAAAPTHTATASDWAPLQNSTAAIPDPALNDLAKGGVAIPLSPPGTLASPQTVPLGVPVKSAIDGNYYQDKATITPTSTTDPTKVDLQVVKQQTDAAGNPAVNPATNSAVTPQTADDACAAHPDRVGCATMDNVATPDITQNAKTVTIAPDTGWGADSAACPADQALNLKSAGAGSISLSWQPTCNFMTKIRPLVLACAWISATLIAVGLGRKGGD